MLSILALSHPSMKELSAAEYAQRFENETAAFSFACKAENGLRPLEFNYDEAKNFTCNCPEGSVLSVSITDDSKDLSDYLRIINLRAVHQFMELQNIEAVRLSTYTHNNDFEIIFETRNEAGNTQYWEYENKD